MNAPQRCWIAATLLAAGLLSAAGSPGPRGAGPLEPKPSFFELPLSFEPNTGQAGPEVLFLSRGPGYAFLLTASGAVMRTRAGEVKLRLAGARAGARARGIDPLPARSHYLSGRDPRRWQIGVPHFTRVHYPEVYPGIDLVFYGREGRLEFDFVLVPGARADKIRLAYEAPGGPAPPLAIDPSGDLVVRLEHGELRQRQPRIYQERARRREEVEGGYVLRGGQVGFRVSEYDASRPLVIDPALTFSTRVGGSRDEQAFAVAVDSEGNPYIAGLTESTDFPTAGPARTRGAAADVFVAKLNAAGTSLVYSTYLGGSDHDRATAIAVDAAGNAYVTGVTTSSDFPTRDALQRSHGGALDAFVARLDPGGNLAQSTYLGGTGDDVAAAIAVRGSGSIYITGATDSPNFPLANALYATLMGTTAAFAAKLNAAMSQLAYSTYLGGSGVQAATGIAVDGAGNAYVVGTTTSTDFPTGSAVQPAHAGGLFDAFVLKLDPEGGRLLYATYLGGSGLDRGLRIAIDGAGSAYVTGDTDSADFPTAVALQARFGGSVDAFAAKLSPAGSALLYSTYLGGRGADAGTAVAVDSAGSLHLAGITASPDFPTSIPLQTQLGDSSADGFVARFDPAGRALIYSTHLGGRGADYALGLVLDAAGDVLVLGQTSSADFPRTASLGQVGAGGDDLFLAKVAAQPAAIRSVLYFPRLVSTDGSQSAGDDSEFTGIAVANLGGSPATLAFTAFDRAGLRVTGASVQNPAASTLGPGQQLPIVDAQLFGTGFPARNPVGWLRLESTAERIVGFFLMFNRTLSILDGVDVGSARTASFILPEIEDEGFTQVHVVNPNPEPAAVTFELVRPDGAVRSTAARTVPANGAAIELLDDLFQGLRPFAVEYVRVSSSRPVIGFEYLGKEQRYVHALAGQDAGSGSPTLYAPQYIVGGRTYRSTLSLVNLERAPVVVTLDFIRDDGSALGARRTLSIPAGGKVHVTDQSFFVAAGDTLTQGYVRASSNGARLAGSVVFGDPERQRFSSALPLVSRLASALAFSQLASDRTFFTGIALLNPGTDAAELSIEVRRASGDLIERKTETLRAGQRKSQLLSEYFPALAAEDLSSGYTRVISNRPLAAFALFGTHDLSVLSAVPAQVVPE